MKFIHAADIHLDSPLKGLERYEGAPVDEIREATRKALRNLVTWTLEQQADLLILAGDLYDGDWNDYNTGLYFVSQMRKLREANVPVFLISGNHDAINKMTRSLRLPDNVTHFEAKRQKPEILEDLGVAVHGRSYGRRAESTNLTRDYSPAVSELYNIGILHTSLVGTNQHDNYAPCTLDDLQAKGYDYWALGHIHQQQQISNQPHIWYSGNLQGRHIRETGAKGCLQVSVDSKLRSDVSFCPLDVFRWVLCRVNVESANNSDDVLDQVAASLAQQAAEHAPLPLGIRVVLEGATPLHDRLASAPRDWTRQIQALALNTGDGQVWVESVRVETQPLEATGGAVELDGPLAEIARLLQELQTDSAARTELAGELEDLCRKLEVLSGQPGQVPLNDDAALVRLLGEVEPMLLGRLRTMESST